MVFTQSSLYAGGDIQDGAIASQQLGLDSITLGQLKAMVNTAPKPKARRYKS